MKQKILMLLLVLALALSCVACGTADKEPTSEKETTQPTDTQELPDTTLPPQDGVIYTGDISNFGANDTKALSNYAVLEATPNDANMSKVVAINDKSEICLTNGQLQVYYWIEFYNFMNTYGSYAAMIGLDTTKPLSEQQSMQEGSTWEQYFLEAATLHYNENYALAQSAYANGYTLSDEDEAKLADLYDPNGEFAADAVEYGYETVEAYIQANFGTGVSVQDYEHYMRTYYAAYNYYNAEKEAYAETLTDEDIEAHYDENAEVFEEKGTLKVNNIKVRHILISVEGEVDENGEYPAEAWTAAEEKANELYQQWLTNPTEENFIEMANAHSTDPGSNTNGGLYDDVYPGQTVPTFNDWCFDEARAVGDHGIVETDYGYHIMFFVGQSENAQWRTAAKDDMVALKMNAMLDEIIAQYGLKFDYTQVSIYDMVSNSTPSEETE